MQIDNSLKPFQKKWKKLYFLLPKIYPLLELGEHTSMLDLIKVEVYGQLMPINQIGTISVSDPQTLTIQIWDNNNVKFCEKALRESSLNLNPIIDGQILRIPIPKLRRIEEKTLKNCKSAVRKNKISIRNIRRSGMDFLKSQEKDKIISGDENKSFQMIYKK